MSYTFQILCNDCEMFMRFDKSHYDDFGIMKWMCWGCEQCVNTTDLMDTVIR